VELFEGECFNVDQTHGAEIGGVKNTEEMWDRQNRTPSFLVFLAKFIQRADWLTEDMEPLATVGRGTNGRPAGSNWAIIRAILRSDLGAVYMPEMATSRGRQVTKV
jgi:hypothetical protein